jgi:hypothetical protein
LKTENIPKFLRIFKNHTQYEMCRFSCAEDGGGAFLRNSGACLHASAASQPTRDNRAGQHRSSSRKDFKVFAAEEKLLKIVPAFYLLSLELQDEEN